MNWEVNPSALGFFALDDVEGKKIIVQMFGEGTTNEADLLIEGIVEGICEALDVRADASWIDGGSYGLIDGEEFIVVIGELLEGDAFGMAKIEKVESLAERSKGNFQIVIIRKEETEVSGDDQTARCLILQESLAESAKAHTSLLQLGDALVYFVDEAGRFGIQIFLHR